MKRAELEALGLSKEQIDSIMKLHGDSVNAQKTEAETNATRVKTLEKELEDKKAEFEGLNNQFNDYKKSKMTDEEARKAEEEEKQKAYQKILDNAKQSEIRYNDLVKSMKVKDILAKNGIVGDDAKALESSLIGKDEQETEKRANDFVEYVKKVREDAASKAVEDLTKRTPTPQGSSGGNQDDKINITPGTVW